MKIITKRTVSAACVMMMAAALLSACGDGDDTQEALKEKAQALAEAAEDTAEIKESVSEEDTAADGREESAPADISALEGSWKADDGLYYLTFDASGNWVFTLLSGEEKFKGTTDEGDGEYMSLVNTSDGSVTGMVKLTDEGLMSNDGRVLKKMDKMLLLPTPQDPLDEVANFPGSFGNISVNYPEQLMIEERKDIPNSIMLKPVMGYGTRDAYSDILFKFMPMTTDYDKFLGHGYEVSKEAMRILLNKCFERLYGPYLIKSLGTDFKDCGDYLSITGYMQLDGKMFTVDTDEPVRGRMEVRYYGPIGYALTVTTIALEDRFEDYCNITDNIMSTNTIVSQWSTSPKPVPDKPGKAIEQAEGGYFWLDSDGDKWFWNGQRNIFVTFHKEVVIKKTTKNKAAAYRDRSNPWSDPPENDFATLLDVVDSYSEYMDQDGAYEELMDVIDNW